MSARVRIGLAALCLHVLPVGAAVAAPTPSSPNETATVPAKAAETPGTPAWVQIVVASMGVLAGAWIAKRQISSWKKR